MLPTEILVFSKLIVVTVDYKSVEWLLSYYLTDYRSSIRYIDAVVDVLADVLMVVVIWSNLEFQLQCCFDQLNTRDVFN